MFRAGLTVIIRKYYSVYTAIGICDAEKWNCLKLLKYIYIYIVVKKRKTFAVSKISNYVKRY